MRAAGSLIFLLAAGAAAAQHTYTPSDGDPARGKAIFESQGCKNCHRVRGEDLHQGPDLSDIGANRRAAEIEKSILDPDAEILQNRMVRVVAKDDSATTGKLLNQNTFNVMILDSKDRLVTFPRAQLREMTFIEKSPMPDRHGERQEFGDAVGVPITVKWEFKMADVTDSGILTTDSDLLFAGGRDGHFVALDARNGNLLGKATLGGGVFARPITYAVNDRQYVAISAGSSLFTSR
jgi:putative heme-binding domain-containing protein